MSIQQDCFIYKLTNKSNKKSYIGRTYNPRLRFQQHMSALKSNRHTNELMQSDYNNGCEFEFSILMRGDCGSRTNKERDFILDLKTYDKEFGYNYKDPVVFSNKGKATKHVVIDREVLHDGRTGNQGNGVTC